jgi:hypothetical protein
MSGTNGRLDQTKGYLGPILAAKASRLADYSQYMAEMTGEMATFTG